MQRKLNEMRLKLGMTLDKCDDCSMPKVERDIISCRDCDIYKSLQNQRKEIEKVHFKTRNPDRKFVPAAERTKRRRLTQKEVDEIMRMREMGYTYEQIGARIGRSGDVVGARYRSEVKKHAL